MTEAAVSPEARSGARYSAVAILLHWLIAALLILQIVLGWRMQDVSAETRAAVLQLHKSIGLTILLLSFTRLAWRLMNPPPPEAEGLSNLERTAARWVHRGLYAILIGLPLTGWIMISATRGGNPTRWFNLFVWPKIPGLSLLPAGPREFVANAADYGHVALVWLTFALLVLHVAGALKHQLVSRDLVMGRMLPGLRPGALVDGRLLAVPLAALLAGALAYVPKGRPPTPRPPVSDVAAADVFLDVVHPAVIDRCSACHGDDRTKGGFSVVSYQAMMAGGDSGQAIVRGDPAKSDFFRRISLPNDHADYMPADGKTPLSDEQVAAIGWWISVGAPASGRVGTLRQSDDIRPALVKVLGLGGASGAQGSDKSPDALPAVVAADVEAVRALENSGFVVRQTVQGSNLVEVNRYAKGPLGEADVANLRKINQQVRTLILRNSPLTDAQLAAIGPMPNVSQLRLEQTGITDAGLVSLAGAKDLTILNLYGTRITDAGLLQLAGLPKLRHVNAWETLATSAGGARLMAQRPGLAVQTALSVAEPRGAVSRPSPVGPVQGM